MIGFLLQAPNTADAHIREKIAKLGLISINLPEPEKRFSTIRYSNIDLDAEGRSSIETLTVKFNPIALLLKHRIDHIDIQNLFLSGTIDTNGQLTLSGIKKPSKLLALTQSNITNINLRNTTLSLLTAHLGGIRLESNLNITNTRNKSEWTGNIKSKQSQFELIAKLTGQMGEDQKWQNDVTIENAKIERDIGKITRVSGNASLYGEGPTTTNITSDFKAGGMTLLGLPWQNIAIAANGSPDQIKTFVSAESIGIKNLELGFEGVLKNKNYAWNARIFAPNASAAFEFLSLQNNFVVPESLPLEITAEKEIELEFKRRQDSGFLIIKDVEKNEVLKTYTLQKRSAL